MLFFIGSDAVLRTGAIHCALSNVPGAQAGRNELRPYDIRGIPGTIMAGILETTTTGIPGTIVTGIHGNFITGIQGISLRASTGTSLRASRGTSIDLRGALCRVRVNPIMAGPICVAAQFIAPFLSTPAPENAQ